jgi:hypothetical protein
MLFCKEIKYPTISLEALSGFTEDKRAARRFARRFWPFSLTAVAAFLGCGTFIFIPLLRGQTDPVPQIYVVLAVSSFAVCLTFFIIAWRRMVSCVPIDEKTSEPLEVFQLMDSIKDEKYELVYVCRQKRTFFRVVYRAPGD